MKHRGKPGKRQGPTGYRTPSTFLHRKVGEVKRLKRYVNQRRPGR